MRVGAVDIGTNTVRLLIRDGDRELERRTLVVSLGAGLDATGRLSPEAMDRAAIALAEYGALLDHHDVARRRAVATSACRDAGNAAEFLDRVAPLLGARPEVITGEKEASLSFRGATAAFPGGGAGLVIDPGGGSTEFVYGTDRVEFSRSIDIGSVRLTDRMDPLRPAPASVVAAARAMVAAAFRVIDLPGAPERVIGVAGTFTSLAAIHLDLAQYDRSRVHGTVLAQSDLDWLVERLAGLTIAETVAIPGIDPKRAPVLLAGSIVAAEAVRRVADQVIVSEYDMLDAIAADSIRG